MSSSALARAYAEIDRLRVDLDHVRSKSIPTRVLKDHYLVTVECDHERGQDRPVCACSRVDLGWHPSVGHAVEAWTDHLAALGEMERP